MKTNKIKTHQKYNTEEINQKKSVWYKPVLIQLGLIALAALLFAGSFPNLLIKNGLPFLAYFAYVPILIIIRKNNVPACACWGAVYGLAAYGLFNYWLGAFHPMAGTIVYSIYMVYLAVVFTFLKLADILFPKKAYLVQWIIWLAYEYLRTLGFLGYSYGVTGYSQWRFIPLIQIASITGVWGVSALVTFPSFFLGNLFNHEPHKHHKNNIKNNFNSFFIRVGSCWFVVKNFLKNEKIIAIIWATIFIGALLFGFTSLKDFSSYPSANISLIQHNTDPWAASKAPISWAVYEAYRNDLSILKRLSDEALAADPKPQMVVWPETAFVPRIYWHSTYRDDPDSWAIVKDLLEYLSEQDVPFLIGNDDARIDPAKNPNPAQGFRVDYNAAILFNRGRITEIYRKLRLVPFTEHFPYEKQLPFMYNALEKADTHFWEKGDKATVFKGPGFNFSSPICFEDSFGYLSRDFILQGADVLVNISNDAWANSLPSQNQHLSMAVFRSVENFRPMVRSTASGQTCAVDPNGRVTAEAPPFTEAYLNVTIPLINPSSGNNFTFYTLYGDYLGLIFTFTAILLLIIGVVWYIIRKNYQDRRG